MGLLEYLNLDMNPSRNHLLFNSDLYWQEQMAWFNLIINWDRKDNIINGIYITKLSLFWVDYCLYLGCISINNDLYTYLVQINTYVLIMLL